MIIPQTVAVVLDALTSQNIIVSVSATDLELGTYQLTPEVRVLVENVLVESILPGTVEVVIAVPDTPTPSLGP